MRLFLDSNIWTNKLGIHKKHDHPKIATEFVDKIIDASRNGADIEVLVTRFQKDELISVIKHCYPLRYCNKNQDRRLLIANFNDHFGGCIPGVVQLIDNLIDIEDAGFIFNECSKYNRDIQTPGYADLLLYEHVKPLGIEYYISFDKEFVDYLKLKGEQAYLPEEFDLI